MGPVLRTRVARGSPRTGINSTDKKSRILADKTNHNYYMPFRRKRKVASPWPNPGREISCSNEQKACIYKLGNSAENQDFPLAERLAVYTFEVSENEPPPNKAKCKRKVQKRKKMDLSDATDEEYIPPVRVKKQMKSGVRRRGTRQENSGTTSVTRPEISKDLLEASELNISLGELASEQVSTSCRSNLPISDEHIPPVTVKRQVRSEVGRSTRQEKPANTSVTRSENVKDLSEESELNISLCELASEQVSTLSRSNLPFSDEHSPPVTVNRQVRSKVRSTRQEMPANTSVTRPENVEDLSEDSELNISLVESASEQVSTSCRNDLPFSPIEQHLSQAGAFVTMRQPRKGKGTHAIWSVEDFTIDNYFGFDEESENDLRFSLSPMKTAHSLKPILSAPFVVSSTPKLKPSFTRMEANQMRLMQRGAKQPASKIDFMSVQSTAALSVPATWSAIVPLSVLATKATTSLLALPAPQNTTTLLPAPFTQGTTPLVPVPDTRNTTLLPEPTTPTTSTLLPAVTPLPASELSVTSDTSLNAIKVARDPSPVLFMEESVMTQHFSKPPRRSYERSVRSRHESHAEEESLSEDETCSRKRVKRSKKTRLEEKIVERWAANVSAQFDEIDGFELCVE